MSGENNPFIQLSNLFIENQRQFNLKTDELTKRVKDLQSKLNTLVSQVEKDVFTTNLTSLINIEEESALILSVAKELEFQRDQVLNSVAVLSKSKQVKLNK